MRKLMKVTFSTILSKFRRRLEQDGKETGEPESNKSSQTAWLAALRYSQLAILSSRKKSHLLYNYHMIGGTASPILA